MLAKNNCLYRGCKLEWCEYTYVRYRWVCVKALTKHRHTESNDMKQYNVYGSGIHKRRYESVSCIYVPQYISLCLREREYLCFCAVQHSVY